MTERKKVHRLLEYSKEVVEKISGLSGSRLALGSVSYRKNIEDGYVFLLNKIREDANDYSEFSLLDLGVGKGWSTYILSHFFKDAVAYDLEQTIAEHSNNTNPKWQKEYWDFFKQEANNIDYHFFEGNKIPEPERYTDMRGILANTSEKGLMY